MMSLNCHCHTSIFRKRPPLHQKMMYRKCTTLCPEMDRYRIGPNPTSYLKGSVPYRPEPYWPHEKIISAAVNNHIGHRKMYYYLVSTFKSYLFETRNVICNPISHKLRVKELNNCRRILKHFDVNSFSDHPL